MSQLVNRTVSQSAHQALRPLFSWSIGHAGGQSTSQSVYWLFDQSVSQLFTGEYLPTNSNMVDHTQKTGLSHTSESLLVQTTHANVFLR